MDVDWAILFKSFYASVKMKVVVRDISKVPPGRIVEMVQKLYMLTFDIESSAGSNLGDDPPGPSNVEVQQDPLSLMDIDNNSVPPATDSDAAIPTPHTNDTPAPPVSTRSFACTEPPLVIDVTDVNFSDHISWNGEDNDDHEFADDLVPIDSPCSIPAKWDYSRMEDLVWDFDPSELNMEEMIETESSKLLEQSSASLTYCASVLKDNCDAGSDNDSEDELVDVEDGVTLAPEICEQVISTKRSLFPSLEQVDTPVATTKNVKKSKWGPVVAPRMSTRNHGAINVLEKAKEYQKRKNLEVPPRFKGKKLARIGDGLEQGNCMSWALEVALLGCSTRGAQ
ncbi:hypothetical protein ACQ4PT_044549 [Festuca glaucescens]